LRVSTDRGAQPRWRGDGNEIFCVRLDRKTMAAPVIPTGDGRTLEVSRALPLFDTHYSSRRLDQTRTSGRKSIIRER
jgi:hypothetical protein